ncbi:MAG: RluA family pseudouridine synthase [Candidatus Eisenbacteria bacterium]|uniref:Pseudouridine synthase n=1 Tax=Eiseniibacteriota bacterium TaxID=2212470 RepID=A0A948W7E9_UNCEI|nr:RluA family pseudouridine synthase [Candidatus Eisenbacteria bacterium]MBU1950478.1 RluA family pseudouridine synthase [Candidatus Eisenbacteria bacterium]MBU2692529.1 RluA family pseudouridine synthase [Candidatus Eisenbacteria bacterium]
MTPPEEKCDETRPPVGRLDSGEAVQPDLEMEAEQLPGPDDDELRTMAGWVRWGCTQIDPADAGERLDRYLARRFTYRSRTDWAQKIREGRIRIDERIIRPSYLLKTGDMLQYRARLLPEPEVDADCPTVYEDDALLAVNKSGNIPVHPAGRYFRNSLLLQLEEHKYGRGILHIVHRLDRETSGVILFTKSSAWARELSFQFENRKIEKTYLAVVWGHLENERLIDLPLGQNGQSKVRKAVGIVPGGRPSRTQVRPLSYGEKVTLVEARPLTGRLHQIRVHLRAIGHPILGDKLYGKDEEYFLKFLGGTPLSEEDYEDLGFRRQALHAWKISIEHPVSKELLEITAPPNSELKALFEKFKLEFKDGSS